MSSYDYNAKNSFAVEAPGTIEPAPDINLDLVKAYSDHSRVADELAGATEAFLHARERFYRLSLRHRALAEEILKLRSRDGVE